MSYLRDLDVSALEGASMRFRTDDVIYAEGHQAEHVYFVRAGRVRLVKGVRGAERSLAVAKAGGLFGEEALVTDGPRTISAVGLSDGELVRLTRDELLDWMKADAARGAALTCHLASRIRQFEEQLENAMLRDRPSRVVNSLLKIARDPDGDSQRLEVTPLELASRVGLGVDAVKRVIQQLRHGGYVEIEHEAIVVPDLGALDRLYELLGLKERVRGDDNP